MAARSMSDPSWVDEDFSQDVPDPDFSPSGGSGDGRSEIAITPVRSVISSSEKRARASSLRGQLDELQRQVGPVRLAVEQLLPVDPAFDAAFPEGGVVRGAVIELDGPAVGSLAWGLVAEATRSGSWVAVVGAPELGLLAAGELGVDLGRCVVVDPGPEPERWIAAQAALVGAAAMVITRPPVGVTDRQLRRLGARCRERGTSIVQLPPTSAAAARLRADRRLRVDRSGWLGLGSGEGRLVARRLELVVEGRGMAARSRRFEMWLPGPEGRPVAVASRSDSPLHLVSGLAS